MCEPEHLKGHPDALFRRVAASTTVVAGLGDEEREAVVAEVVDHLTTAWICARSQGMAPNDATRHVLASFGDSSAIRGAFLRETLGRHLKRGFVFSTGWIAILAADAMVGVMQYAGQTAPSRTLLVLVGWVMYNIAFMATTSWLGWGLVRFGWFTCTDGARGQLSVAHAVGGFGAIVSGVGGLLYLGPGYVMPALCTGIELVAGADTPIALPAALIGLCVGLAGYARGAELPRAG